MANPMIQRALLSVHDQAHLLPLATYLHQQGTQLICTKSTGELISAHQIPFTFVHDYTATNIMDGCLDPKIYSGIVSQGDLIQSTDILNIDLVVANLYPWDKINHQGDGFDELTNYIDIGNHTLIRAAAKHHQWCTILVDPEDYAGFIELLTQPKIALTALRRLHYATKAFAYSASHDQTIAEFFAQKVTSY